MSTAYKDSQPHQRERTQLFQSVDQYNPAKMMRSETPRYASPGPGASYSDSVLNQLESQHDEMVDGLTSKLRVLKDISSKIGVEVQDGSALLQNLEDGFDSARQKVKSTVNRVLVTSREHGIGLREWLGFFVFVWVCFFFVWLF